MPRPLFFFTSYIDPSESSQAKEGATTLSSLVPTTPAVTDEQKKLVSQHQKKINKTDHAPANSRSSFRGSKVIPVNSFMEAIGAIPLAPDLVVLVFPASSLILNFCSSLMAKSLVTKLTHQASQMTTLTHH
jgi:hypothetical protein